MRQTRLAAGFRVPADGNSRAMNPQVLLGVVLTTVVVAVVAAAAAGMLAVSLLLELAFR